MELSKEVLIYCPHCCYSGMIEREKMRPHDGCSTCFNKKKTKCPECNKTALVKSMD